MRGAAFQAIDSSYTCELGGGGWGGKYVRRQMGSLQLPISTANRCEIKTTLQLTSITPQKDEKRENSIQQSEEQNQTELLDWNSVGAG